MQLTQKLYYEEPFLQEFSARVLACTPDETGRFSLVLDATAFYPEGGGQPCDTGTLLGADGTAVQVTDVQETDGIVTHTVSGALPVGAAVTGQLNWAARRDAMEQHTGEHILNGVLFAMFGAANVGFHIGAELVRMDLSRAVDAAGLAEAERRANAFIRADLPIEQRWPTSEELAGMTYRSKKALEGPVRLVVIPGVDVCACCGTHLTRTGQVGLVKILTSENYKGGTRLMVVCGGRALAAMAAEHAQALQAGALVSVKPEGLAQAVSRLLAENEALKAQRAAAQERWFAAEAAALPAGVPVVRLEPTLSGDSLRRFALTLAARSGAAALFTPGSDGASLSYVLAARADGGNMQPLAKALNAAFSGRGGGKPNLCQGSLNTQDFAKVKDFFNENAF